MKAKPKKRARIRLTQGDDGKFQIEGLETWYAYWRDPYHLLLTIPVWGFIPIVAIAYIFLNAIFALLYLAGGDCLAGARPGSFEDAFFFSVQTFASIGYGVISPKNTYANVVVSITAITSLVAIAVVTGLTFARLAKPTARVTFSRYAVIAPHNGIPTLMFRMANQRRNQIVEAQLHVYLLRDEITQEGNFIYRILDLPLLRDRTPAFALSWTAMHPIAEDSPLYGATPESLANSHTQIALAMSGIDETVAYSVNFFRAGSPPVYWRSESAGGTYDS
jgi:inward rectifier potassium channel